MDGRYGAGGYYGSPAYYYQRRGERTEQKIQNLLNMMLAMKQTKYDREQREWQKKRQEEADVRAQEYLDIAKERLEASKQPTVRPLQKWQYEQIRPIPKNIARGLDKHLITTFGTGWRDKISYPQFVYHRDMWKSGELKTPPVISATERQITKQHKLDVTLINSLINRYKQEKDRYTRQREGMPSALDIKGKEKYGKLTSGLENMETALTWLYSAQGNLASGRPLPNSTRKRMQEIGRNMTGVKEGTLIEKITSEANLELQGRDKFGYRAGEIKQAQDGTTWEYIGNNQWRMKR